MEDRTVVLAVDDAVPHGAAEALAGVGARLEPGAQATIVVATVAMLRRAHAVAPAEAREALKALVDASSPITPAVWIAGGHHLEFGTHALVLGVLNVTPDSFYDGGRFTPLDAAERRAWEIAEEGASILDVGGRSYASTVAPATEDDELVRVLPIVEALVRARYPLPISIDTTRARVAERALASGAAIVNDCSGLADPRMASVLAGTGAGAIVMHVRGTLNVRSPQAPAYRDIMAEVAGMLWDRMAAASEAGVAREALVFDPGLEFGKTPADDCEILARFGELRGLGRPLVVAASRKSFLGSVTGRPSQRLLSASLAAAATAIERGARLVRAHDVAESVDLCRTLAAVRTAEEATARLPPGS